MKSFSDMLEKPLKLKELFKKILEITPKLWDIAWIILLFTLKQNIYENKVSNVKSVYKVLIGKDSYFQSWKTWNKSTYLRIY